jgi:phage FluMu protein gp41
VKRQMFVPTQVLRGMRAYEKYALDIAKLFGEIRRKQAQLIRMENVGRLMAYIQHITGRNYDDELARLITNAHEVVGSKKQFSADQLKKLRQRHFPKPQAKMPSFLEALAEQLVMAGEAAGVSGQDP